MFKNIYGIRPLERKKIITCNEMKSIVESLSKLEHLDISGRRFADNQYNRFTIIEYFYINA